MGSINTSVWFEQVDTALITLIQSKILVKGAPVNATVRKPEKEFSISVFPSVTVSSLSAKYAPMRDNPNHVSILSVDNDDHTAVIEERAIPYDLSYQIDFWSKYQADMNDMTMQWLGILMPSFPLPLHDYSGADRVANCFAIEPMKKKDFLEGNDRYYHSFITYKIWVEVDLGNTRTVPIVSERVIST